MADPDYFTLAEFRALPDCGGTTFTDAQINAAAAFFVKIVEREIEQPMIPRTFTETLRGDGCASLMLGRAYIRSLTTVTVGGVTVDVSGLDATAGVLRYASNTVYGSQAWTSGAKVVVTYSAGPYATCPDDIKDAVMWATRDRLLNQQSTAGSWDRKSSEISDFGTVNYVLPGEKRPTGYPDLDAILASYARVVPNLGFA